MLKDSDIGKDLNSDGQENLYLNSKIDLYIGNEKVNFDTIFSNYLLVFKMTVPRILPTPPIVSQYCPEWDLIWFPGLIPGAIFVCVYIPKGVFLGDCTNGTLTTHSTDLVFL